MGIPKNRSSGWTNVVLNKTRSKQLSKVLSVCLESKVRNYLIFHTQVIPRTPNPPHCSHKQKIGGTIYAISQPVIQIITLEEGLIQNLE
jgi:hypothetical protein